MIKNMSVVYKRLERLHWSLQYGLIQWWRAVGNLLKIRLLLNIQDIGRNITKSSIVFFMQIYFHVVCELKGTSVTQWFEIHLSWEWLLFKHLKFAVKSHSTRLDRSWWTGICHNVLPRFLLFQALVGVPFPRHRSTLIGMARVPNWNRILIISSILLFLLKYDSESEICTHE